MKTNVYLLFLTLVLFSCKNENEISKTEAVHFETYSIEQFMNNESVGAAGFSSDLEKVLLTSNRSGIYNIYTVASSGGSLTPITQSDSASIFAESYFPNDDRILFSMDGNGDEINKLFVKDGDSIFRITPEKNVRTTFFKWSKDETSFFYTKNERDPQYMDVYKMNVEDFTSELIYENTQGYEPVSISSDGKYITLAAPVTSNDNDLFLYTVDTEEIIKINETQSANMPQSFTPDNAALYYTTDEGSEFSKLMKYDLATRNKSLVAQKDWDISSFRFSKNGKYSMLFTNEDAKTKVEVSDVATGEIIDFPDFEGMEVTSISFSDDATKVLIYVGGSFTPTNIYTYDLASEELVKLTEALNPEIIQENLVEAEVIRFKSFDSLEIPAIYYLPKQASQENKVPALVFVHGGPGGQSRTGYSSVIQYLVNHGYAVLAVNNRGSSGYGKTFFNLDNQNHGDKDLKDCIAGKDWLASQPQIDAEKIGILGGSYGGYMTMAALTYAPDEFEVGVNLFGVTNWIRTLKSIPPWWSSFKDALYDELGNPNTSDSIRLKAISPLFHTENVTKPLIVLQGAQDPRVLKIESDEIVEGVRANNVPVEYVVFEDEGHGFIKKENQIEAYESILSFLNKYLKKDRQEDADIKKEATTIEAE